MSLTVRPLSDALGAEVGGIDLSVEMDRDTFSRILKAWHQHLVLLFRKQKLSSEGQTRFARLFGDLEEVRSRPSYASQHLMFVSNVPVEGKEGVLPQGAIQFHFDQCYYERPAKATLLYAIEVPSTGGNTLFANAQMAYARLPGQIQRQIHRLKALHVYDYDSNPTARGREISPDAPRFIHPVVTLHPETGRRGLYVNRLMTDHLVGLPRQKSDELLDYLLNHQESREFIYEHAWQPGDLILWDNRCSLHARKDFDPCQKRILRRLTVRGERPVGLEETNHPNANQ